MYCQVVIGPANEEHIIRSFLNIPPTFLFETVQDIVTRSLALCAGWCRTCSFVMTSVWILCLETVDLFSSLQVDSNQRR
jgi:hypothetical protein